MNVLVTGGNGMVGKNFQEYITKMGYNEFNFLFASRQEMDLTDKKNIEVIFKKMTPDVVIHLAADVGGVYYNNENNQDLYDINTIMNKNIMEAIKVFKVKYAILVLSTCIYPDNLTSASISKPLKEEEIMNGPPHSSNRGYALSKRQLYEWSKNPPDGSKYICLVPTNLYGKYDYFDNQAKAHVIPALIGKLKRDFPIVCGNLDSKRQYLHVTDFVKVMYEILQCFRNNKYQHLHDIYNIGPRDVTTLGELSDLIFGKDHYHNRFDNVAQLTRVASYDRFKEHFPDIFNNMVTLKDGISELMELYT